MKLIVVIVIFYWKNNSSRIENEETEDLRKFLKKEFNWKWITKANIVLSDLSSLEISKYRYHALISLNKQKDGATLSLNGKPMFEFIVRQTEDMLIIEAPTKQRLSSFYLEFFQLSQRIRIQKLIFSILSAYGTVFAIPALQILQQDKKFMQCLQDTKKQFDKRYRLFSEGKK